MRFLSETIQGRKQIGSAGPNLPQPRRATTTRLAEVLYRGLTHPIRLLPDFLIIGAQRGGTTSLYNYLQAHPCFELPTTKELHFFDRKFHRGLAWYRAHFPTYLEKCFAQRIQGRAFLTGEATPNYLFHPLVSRRVAEVLPCVKLIVLLRNPVDRAFSHYHHILDLGYEHLPFAETIQREEERIGRERERILTNEHYGSYVYEHFSYMSRGKYIEQLQTWMRLFSREQFLILKSEDFYTNPPHVLQQILAFLDVPEAQWNLSLRDYVQYNRKTAFHMDAAQREQLLEYYKPYNARLYDFLGIDFGWDT